METRYTASVKDNKREAEEGKPDLQDKRHCAPMLQRREIRELHQLGINAQICGACSDFAGCRKVLHTFSAEDRVTRLNLLKAETCDFNHSQIAGEQRCWCVKAYPADRQPFSGAGPGARGYLTELETFGRSKPLGIRP
jgi:hypothetical protein